MVKAQLARLAAQDQGVMKKLNVLYDGTEDSMQSLPPVSLFQGGQEAPAQDDVTCNGEPLLILLHHNES